MSDSMNEFDRFAWAYLIFKGYQPPSEMEARDIKRKKIFGVDADGAVQFLTKDINSDFIKFMAEWIRKEIHKQTHVPDFLDAGKTGDSLSGVAIDKLLYDFEFVAATKEALFKDGLYQRIQLINNVMGQGRAVFGLDDSPAGLVDITFNRNKPSNYIENADLAQKYTGILSQQTIIKEFAPFVDSVDDEMELIAGEQGPDMGYEGDEETRLQSDNENAVLQLPMIQLPEVKINVSKKQTKKSFKINRDERGVMTSADMTEE
jgi:SPP1 family phage portal protein